MRSTLQTQSASVPTVSLKSRIVLTLLTSRPVCLTLKCGGLTRAHTQVSLVLERGSLTRSQQTVKSGRVNAFLSVTTDRLCLCCLCVLSFSSSLALWHWLDFAHKLQFADSCPQSSFLIQHFHLIVTWGCRSPLSQVHL